MNNSNVTFERMEILANNIKTHIFETNSSSEILYYIIYFILRMQVKYLKIHYSPIETYLFILIFESVMNLFLSSLYFRNNYFIFVIKF